ncbi:discoidin domain-containing protein [Paenibacillus sp. TH7-28]
MAYYSDNIIPNMTSNTTPSGEVSAINGSNPYYAFNSNSSDWVSSTTTKPLWIQYKFNAKRIVTKYTVTVTPNGVAGMMTKWDFQGSKNGTNWVVLDSRSGINNWGNGEKKEFTFSNSTPYLYYRITIYETVSSGFYTRIRNIQMMETIYENKSFLIFDNKCLTITTDSYKIFELIDENDYINNGIIRGTTIELSHPLTKKIYVNREFEVLGTGKVFKQKLDTNKTPIKKSKIL